MGKRIDSACWHSRIQSQVSLKDKAVYSSVAVSGDIFVSSCKVFVKVGSVDFQQDNSQGNPVLSYLQHHGTPRGLNIPLSNGGYTVTTPDMITSFKAPFSNELYSKISSDFNPIHAFPILHPLLPLSLMECGQVQLPVVLLKVWLPKDTQNVSLRKISF
jgi:fatty acid synthase subunit beta